MCEDPIRIKCARNSIILSTENAMDCNEPCPLECNSLHFYYEQSSLSFPTTYHAKHLQQNILQATKSLQEVKESMASVRIHYETLDYKLITEERAISFTSLLASVGGVLGLFLGMSWLSFIEIFEIVYEIALTLLHYKK